jgi:hypothetical protein
MPYTCLIFSNLPKNKRAQFFSWLALFGAEIKRIHHTEQIASEGNFTVEGKYKSEFRVPS